MSFDRALAIVLESEGGFAHHPADPGGETYQGITAHTLAQARDRHPDLHLPARVGDLQRGQVREIYLRDYWRAAKCHDLPMPLALLVFDAAVNHGPSGAIRLLQRALGVRDDGQFGPVTLAAVQDALIEALLSEFTAQRALMYGRLPTFAVFGLGWCRRLIRTYREAIRWQVRA